LEKLGNFQETYLAAVIKSRVREPFKASSQARIGHLDRAFSQDRLGWLGKVGFYWVRLSWFQLNFYEFSN